MDGLIITSFEVGNIGFLVSLLPSSLRGYIDILLADSVLSFCASSLLASNRGLMGENVTTVGQIGVAIAILNQENSAFGVFTEKKKDEFGLEFVYDNYGGTNVDSCITDCSILEEIVRIEEESRQKLTKRSKGLRKRPTAMTIGCQSQLEKKSQKIRIFFKRKITEVVDRGGKEKALMENEIVNEKVFSGNSYSPGSSSVSDLKTDTCLATKYVHEKVKRRKIEDLLDEKQSKLENRAKKRKRIEPVVPIEPPGLPDEFKEKIENMGVQSSEVKLVIQKVLYDTDLSNKHMRMSIPVNQVRNKDFLTPQQKLDLEMRDIESNKKMKIQFNLIEPSLEETKIHLAKWDINKSLNYVLLNDWMAVAERNNLKSEMIVQVWSFRQDLVPWLALVLVPDQAALEG
uniref:B3 domain-containing protein At1g05920-like n=1 Tax=Nicotiana tabacum TaxID=4097 RepID=A0A1S4CEG4_TOBAC|nr:B3 domain-containing protein At1g05920-like [Nicotiana tomentosiformis]XP_016499607.1 PREDICTED: B3 domain-containing protein At1g05920-like [Nicotiana tabacum]